MSSSRDKKQKPNVEQAWQALYARFESEGMLVQKERLPEIKSFSFLKWSVAAVLCLVCVGITIHFWPFSSSVEMVAVQNVKGSEVLVTTLPDGSVVFLSEKSTITYPKRFASNQRQVQLEGAAFFEVSKDENAPFRIKTEQVSVEVLGTSFRLRSDGECPFELTVKSGMVKVVLISEDQNVFAEAGEQVQLTATWLQKTYVENIDVIEQSVRRLYFIEESLGQIIHVVNVCSPGTMRLALDDESLLKRAYTVTLDTGSIEGIADLLCTVLDLKQTTVDHVIYIGKK